MGCVPYPAHMGPRFAGPITALRAFKNKIKNKIGDHMWAHQPSKPSEPYVPGNLGQKPHDLGVNVRLYVHLPLPIQAKIKLPTQRVKLYNHACVCSCVGPIVDVKEQSDLFYTVPYRTSFQ